MGGWRDLSKGELADLRLKSGIISEGAAPKRGPGGTTARASAAATATPKG